MGKIRHILVFEYGQQQARTGFDETVWDGRAVFNRIDSIDGVLTAIAQRWDIIICLSSSTFVLNVLYNIIGESELRRTPLAALPDYESLTAFLGDYLHCPVSSISEDVSSRTSITDRDILSDTDDFEAFNLFNEAVFLHDAETGKIIFVNERTCDMYGYTRGEIVEMDVASLSSNVPPYTQNEALDYLSRALTGRPQRFEWQAKHREDFLFWIEITMKKGSINGREIILVSARDISERKLNELTMTETEQRYRAFISNSNEGIFRFEIIQPVEVLELKTRQVATVTESAVLAECNDKFARILGYGSLDDIVGLKVKKILSVQGADQAEDFFSHFIDFSYAIQDYELTRVDDDGNVIFISIGMSGIIENGRLVRLWGVASDITEKRKIEKALRTSEKQFRVAFDNAAISMILVGLDGSFIKVNRKFCEMLGYAEEELYEKKVMDVTHPDETGFAKDAISSEWFGLDYIENHQKRYMARNGRVIWGLLNSILLRDETGKPQYFISHIIDITQAKMDEEAIRLNEERLNSLYKLSQMRDVDDGPVTEFALEEGVRLTGSKAGYLHLIDKESESVRIFLFSKNVIKTCSAKASDMYPVAEAGIWADPYRTRRPVIHNDYENEKGRRGLPDGHFTVERHMSVPIFEGSDIVAIAGVANKETGYNEADVRQLTLIMNEMWKTIVKRRSEKELQKSEERFRGLFEQTAVGVCLGDLDGCIIKSNPAFCNLTGYAESELYGRRFASLVHPDDLPAEDDPIERLLARKDKSYSLDVRLTNTNASHNWVSMTVTVLMNAQATPYGCVFMTENIEERKKAEAEKEKIYKQYLQSQKMEAFGKLAGGIAHDFNNILTAIIGYSELTMKKIDAGDAIFKNISFIKESGERAKKLTNQLLTFSRKQAFEMKPININTVIQNFQKMIDRIIGEDVALDIYLDDALWDIEGDTSQIEQILMNLVINARDAIEEGGHITIETKNTDIDAISAKILPPIPNGSYVALSVTDTGTGMDEETMSQIFEPFFTTKETGKGTGLGLSTVYGIVEAHHGGITVYSEMGSGSCFKILLPRSARTLVETDAAVSAQYCGISGTILLVEDDQMVMQLAKSVLESSGNTVLNAETPLHAIEIAREAGHIDMLLTDLIMPQMNGVKLHEEISTFRPGIKVLFMSGYPENIMILQGMVGGEHHFIAKPFSIAALARKVCQILADER